MKSLWPKTKIVFYFVLYTMTQFLWLESERSENLSKQDIINNIALMIREWQIDENMYNKECMYSPQEHLLYLAGAYSRQQLLEEVSKSDDEKMQQRHSKELQIAIEWYNAEKLALTPYVAKGGAAIRSRIREIDVAIKKLLELNKWKNILRVSNQSRVLGRPTRNRSVWCIRNYSHWWIMKIHRSEHRAVFCLFAFYYLYIQHELIHFV